MGKSHFVIKSTVLTYGQQKMINTQFNCDKSLHRAPLNKKNSSSNLPVGYFIFFLVFHPERKFCLFKDFDGSKVQTAICHRNKSIVSFIIMTSELQFNFVIITAHPEGPGFKSKSELRAP